MAKIILYLGLAVLLAYSVNALTGECPLSSQHTSCSPKCMQDFECASSGGICCRNLCNTKSCVRPKAGTQGSNSGYKGSGSSSATGVYCGSVKCRAHEKCGTDSSTKQQKCIRT